MNWTRWADHRELLIKWRCRPASLNSAIERVVIQGNKTELLHRQAVRHAPFTWQGETVISFQMCGGKVTFKAGPQFQSNSWTTIFIIISSYQFRILSLGMANLINNSFRCLVYPNLFIWIEDNLKYKLKHKLKDNLSSSRPRNWQSTSVPEKVRFMSHKMQNVTQHTLFRHEISTLA